MNPSPDSLLQVAAAQITCCPGDITANLRTHLEAIADARARGVQLLLFPELSLVGHSAGRDAPQLAMHADDPVLRTLAQAAGGMCVGVGLVEGSDEGLYFNSQMLLRDGQVLACHRKVALATYGALDDGKFYARGRRLLVHPVAQRGWRAAVGICNDLWQPALVTQAMLTGATLQLAPVSSALQAVGPGFDNPAAWDLNLRFHAMTWGCPVVMANRVGEEDGLHFWGGSRVVDAYGKVLARAEGETAQLVCATLSLAQVRAARFMLPTLRDARALAPDGNAGPDGDMAMGLAPHHKEAAHA